MILVKNYSRHFGVDKKSSNLTRPPQFAEDLLNADYTPSGSITKRTGWQKRGTQSGSFGQWTYRKADPTTGAITEEIVSVSGDLWKSAQATLTVTYSGASTTCSLAVFLDPATSTFKMQIDDGTSLVLDTDLGTGDEVSPVTLTALAALINAIADFTATVSGTGTVPAAFLAFDRYHDLIAGAYSGVVYASTEVYSPITAGPFATYAAQNVSGTFENISSVQAQNCIYFASGLDELMKYDGQSVYRAGLPDQTVPTFGLAAGVIPNGDYEYIVQYIYKDKAGNLLDGNYESATATVSGGPRTVNVTVTNILAASGFNTNCAIVNGNQVGVTTITVDNTNTLQIGDTAYFLNRISGLYIEAVITNRTSTTITTATSVNVNDNDVISANLRIGIFRSEIGPGLEKYLVAEIPNNSLTATQVYADNTADANLGRLWLEPTTDRTAPPKGKYVNAWNGQLTIAGIPTAPFTLRYSDTENAEYFPADSNELLIESGNGDKITGHAPNNEVYAVFGAQSFTVITGDIAQNQLRVETRSRNNGCAAHATICDMDGTLVWLSADGPRYSQGGQMPLPLGASVAEERQETASRIDPIFDNAGQSSRESWNLQRAVGFVIPQESRYLLFVPKEDLSGSNYNSNELSRAFVYLKNRDAWLIWSNVDISGGASFLSDDRVYFTKRYYDGAAFDSDFMGLSDATDAYGYADGIDAISFDYAPQWEFLGEPSVLKKAISVKIFTVEDESPSPFTLTVEQETNFQKDAPKAIFDMEFLGEGYGVAAYGTTPYGNPGNASIFHPLSRDRVFSTRTRFKNEIIHEAPVISGWEGEFSTPYRPEFKP
jgi:hypothetical protein